MDWSGYKEATKQRKLNDYKRNYDILVRSRLSFITRNDESEFFIRQEGKPDVSFWPSTGRWRIAGAVGKRATCEGGAEAFLKWYEKAKPVVIIPEDDVNVKASWDDKVFALELEHRKRNGR